MQKEEYVYEKSRQMENPDEEINDRDNSLLSSGKSMIETKKTHADEAQVSTSHSSPDQNPLSVKTETIPENVRDGDALDDQNGDNTVQRNEEGAALSLSTPKEVAGSLPPPGQNPYKSEGEDSVTSMKNKSALSKRVNLQAIQVYAGEPQALQFEQIPKTPKKADKALEDGYNWRKYGQKLVKGNEFVRSYYRCTYPNCSTKRQVERSHDGPITDIVYLGQHHHPKPQESSQVSISPVQPNQQKKSDEPSSASGNDIEAIETKGPLSLNKQIVIYNDASTNSATEGRVSQSFKTSHEDGDHKVKKQKKYAGNANEASQDKTYGESRVVVHAQSEVDMVNDGYRWRKYGQKMVKGNPNPRSYYRCTNVCCPVKKHVERDSADPKIVVTTYEGHHNHEIPPGRIVSPNSARSSANKAPVNDHPSPRPQENKPCLDIVVHISAST